MSQTERVQPVRTDKKPALSVVKPSLSDVKRRIFYTYAIYDALNMNAAKLRLEKRRKQGIQDIKAEVSDYFGLETPAILTGKTRDLEISHARQLTMWFIHENYTITDTEIGRQLGNRSQATVAHGLKKIEGKINAKDPFVLGEIEAIQEGIDARYEVRFQRRKK